MALLEATNDYFETVVEQVAEFTKPDREATQVLIPIYKKFTGIDPKPTKLEGLLLEAMSNDVTKLGTDLAPKLSAFLDAHSYLSEAIKTNSIAKLLYAQPSILLAYFLVSQKPSEFKNSWPLTDDELRPIYTDLGNAFESY